MMVIEGWLQIRERKREERERKRVSENIKVK
jgi:hypothetical protein